MNKEEEIKQELNKFLGTEIYYKHWTNALCYTDGMRYLANELNAFWFIDLIASYQYKLKNIKFQLWTIEVKDNKGIVYCQEDSNMPKLIKQELKYTDFALSNFSCYLIDGILLLKSEY